MKNEVEETFLMDMASRITAPFVTTVNPSSTSSFFDLLVLLVLLAFLTSFGLAGISWFGFLFCGLDRFFFLEVALEVALELELEVEVEVEEMWNSVVGGCCFTIHKTFSLHSFSVI